MKNREINKKVSEATNSLIKSDFSAIQRKLEKNEGVILRMETEKKEKINYKKFMWIPALAAASFVVIVGSANRVVTTVTFDVNPSFSFGVASNGEVRKVTSHNDDADDILDDLKVKGMDLDDATEEVINKLVKEGFIDNDKNSVLITTEGDDASDVLANVKKEVQKELDDNKISSTVITQVNDEDDKDLEDLAKENNISIGKAMLIEKLIDENNTLKFEELAKLTTTQLRVLLENLDAEDDDLEIEGTVNNNNYITTEEALLIALNELELERTQIEELSLEYDYNNKILVVEVEFEVNNVKYEVEVNAISGVIIDIDIDTDNDDDDNDSDDNKDNDSDDDNDNDNDDDDNDDDNDSDDDDDDNDND